VRHARVDSLRVQARPATRTHTRRASAVFSRSFARSRITRVFAYVACQPLTPPACTAPGRGAHPQLPSLANYKTEPWVVHLGALEVAIEEVPFGAAGASCVMRLRVMCV
jgi:hypothetical protein